MERKTILCGMQTSGLLSSSTMDSSRRTSHSNWEERCTTLTMFRVQLGDMCNMEQTHRTDTYYYYSIVDRKGEKEEEEQEGRSDQEGVWLFASRNKNQFMEVSGS